MLARDVHRVYQARATRLHSCAAHLSCFGLHTFSFRNVKLYAVALGCPDSETLLDWACLHFAAERMARDSLHELELALVMPEVDLFRVDMNGRGTISTYVSALGFWCPDLDFSSAIVQPFAHIDSTRKARHHLGARCCPRPELSQVVCLLHFLLERRALD